MLYTAWSFPMKILKLSLQNKNNINISYISDGNGDGPTNVQSAMGNEPLEEVNSFQYLGRMVNQDG